jgi:hypothetical protein
MPTPSSTKGHSQVIKTQIMGTRSAMVNRIFAQPGIPELTKKFGFCHHLIGASRGVPQLEQ